MDTQVHFHTGPLQNWGQTWGLGHTEELEQMWALAYRGHPVLQLITLALSEGSFSDLRDGNHRPLPGGW